MTTPNLLNSLKLAVAMAVAAPSLASATIIAGDDFESYPAGGNLQGNSGGTGWGAAWLAPGSSSDTAIVLDTTASQMDFVPLGGADINGGTRAVNCYGTVSTPVAARQLATPLTSTFYVRFLVQYNNTNVPAQNNFGGSDTFALHLSDTASDTSTLNFGMRFSGVSTFMTRNGTSTPAAGATTNTSFLAGVTHLMVAQVVNSSGVFNRINCWLDPAYTSSSSPTITLSAGTLTAINYLFFRVAANESDDRYLINNLVVGGTWEDVVPPGAPPVVQVNVETVADGSGTVVPAQNITAGNSITLYAIARQTNGLFLSNAPAVWSEQNVTGGVISGDLVPSSDGKSAVFTGHLVGSASVMASIGADPTVSSGTLSVVAGSASQVRVQTQPDATGTVVPAQNISLGGHLTVYSIVCDAGGNFLSNGPALWSMPTTTGAVMSTNLQPAGDGLSATFTGNLPGTAVIHASVAGLTPGDSGLLTVVPYGAGIIAMDDFNYPPGIHNLQGQNGGTGWGGPWLAPLVSADYADVVDTSTNELDFFPLGGADINGGTDAVDGYGTTGGGVAERQLATPLTNTFYVRFLVQYNNANVPPQSNFDNADTFSLYLSDTYNDIQTLNFGMRYNSDVGAGTFMVRNGTSPTLAGVFITNQFLPGVTHLMVAQVVNSGGVFNQINGWLDPAYSSLNSPDVTLSAGTLTNINYLIFRIAETATEADDRYVFDSLVIGKTWDDVVPPGGTPVPLVSVETAADGSGTVVPAQTLVCGNSITCYAIARNSGGVFLSNTPAIWSVQNVTGGIVSGNLTPSGDGKSAVFTAGLAGTCTVHAAANATTLVDSGTLTVVPGSAVQVCVETVPDGSGGVVPAQTITSPWSLTVYSISRDACGNFLANIPATWSLQNITSGIASGDLVPAGDDKSATLTGNLSGTATISATSSPLAAVNSGLITVSRAVTWVGGGANPWDHSTADWTADFGVTQTRFYDQDAVTFDSTGSQTPAVNITTAVAPYSVNIGFGGAYTFAGSGKITGLASVTNGSGNALLFTTSNDYSGLTVVTYGTLQVGDGSANGTFGSGKIIVATGDISPIFNRTDTLASPFTPFQGYIVSNTITGPADFTMEFLSGVTTLTDHGPVTTEYNSHATAHVFGGATLILSKTGGGSDIGYQAALGGTNLIVETGGKVILGVPNTVGDHITALGCYVYVDGVLDANGVSEAYGVQVGSGTLDNSASNNCVLTINQGAVTPGVGNNGEIYTFNGLIQNTGAGTLGITKDGNNTMILTSANTYRGDTRIIDGGVLQLGNVNAIQNSTLDYESGDSGTISLGTLTSANLGGLKAAKALGLTNATGNAVALSIGANGQNNTYSGVLSGSGSLVKSGTGTQTLSGTNTYTGTTTVALGTLLVNGALTGVGTVTVNSGVTLGGNGFISGETTIQTGGKVAPGTSIGTLTVNNTATLQGGAVMEINRTNSPNADKLAATSVVLGGTLTVTNIGPAALKSGDSFTLFSGALSGSITPTTLPPLWPGLSWDTGSLNSLGVIRVAGTALPPHISSISVSGGNLTLSGSGGLAGATFYLLSSTNLTLPVSSWTRIATNSFTAGGNFTSLVAKDPSVPQNYFTILAP